VDELVDPAEEREAKHDEKRDGKRQTKMVVDGASIRKLAQVIRDKATRIRAREEKAPKTR
jgi:hypothetical protein